MSKIVIKLSHVGKKYFLHSEKPTFIESINPFNTTKEFWALKDVSLTLHSGDRLGLIGPNGAGKTTLLKIIAGIVTPTTGSVITHGRITSIIELEAGFNPELSGRENIKLNALIAGMSKKLVYSQLPAIIEFAQIGNFIDEPLYTYSSGMKLRLGFSIAIHSQPDILILDENLSVGDQEFQQKSIAFLNSLKNTTIVFASHNPILIDKICNLQACLINGIYKTKISLKSMA